MTRELILSYLRRFKMNTESYPPEIAKKKNADIRKTVMTDGPNERRDAMMAAWSMFYGDVDNRQKFDA